MSVLGLSNLGLNRTILSPDPTDSTDIHLRAYVDRKHVATELRMDGRSASIGRWVVRARFLVSSWTFGNASFGIDAFFLCGEDSPVRIEGS